MAQDTIPPLKKYVDTSHYIKYLGPDHAVDNKVIDAKNALANAQAFSDSVYNEAQDKIYSATNGSTSAKGK